MPFAKPKVTLIRPSAGINHSGAGEAFAVEMSRQLIQSVSRLLALIGKLIYPDR